MAFSIEINYHILFVKNSLVCRKSFEQPDPIAGLRQKAMRTRFTFGEDSDIN